MNVLSLKSTLTVYSGDLFLAGSILIGRSLVCSTITYSFSAGDVILALCLPSCWGWMFSSDGFFWGAVGVGCP